MTCVFLPPANEVCEGYVFYTCLSVHGGGVLQTQTQGGRLRGLAGGVSRPTPRLEVEGSPGPHPGWRLRGLQVHTWEGVMGSPGPVGGYPSMHWVRPPLSRRLLLRAVRILLGCILVNSIVLRWLLHANHRFLPLCFKFKLYSSFLTLW